MNPTPEQKQRLVELLAFGLPKTKIALQLGVTYEQLKYYLKKNPELTANEANA